MIDTPEIVTTQAQKTACIHLVVARDQIRHVMGPGLAEVTAALQAQGISPVGPWFTHHLRKPADTFDFEICVPIEGDVTPVGRVVPGTLPATTVARTIYRGPYEGLGGAWAQFQNWIFTNGYEPAAELWERYLSGPGSGSDPSKWETELNRPVTKT